VEVKALKMKQVIQAAITVIFFELVGIAVFYSGFSYTPQGIGYRMSDSTFEVILSCLWVLAVWIAMFFSGMKKAKGIIIGYFIVVISCFAIIPLFFYIAPISAIDYRIMQVTDYLIHPILIAIIYTVLNAFSYCIGLYFSKKVAHRL
jgi:hypothetical protein